MKKLYFLFLFSLLIISPSARTAFPQWFEPDHAKIDGIWHFYRYMKLNTKDHYRLNVIEYNKTNLENGSEIIQVGVDFSIPSCRRIARLKYLDTNCDQKHCNPLPIEIGECIKTQPFFL